MTSLRLSRLALLHSTSASGNRPELKQTLETHSSADLRAECREERDQTQVIEFKKLFLTQRELY